MNEKVPVTKPWTGCFVYIFTGRKPNYDLPQIVKHNIWLLTPFLQNINCLPASKKVTMSMFLEYQVHKKVSKLEIMTSHDVIFRNIHKTSNAFADSSGRYIKCLIYCKMYEKRFTFLNSCF